MWPFGGLILWTYMYIIWFIEFDFKTLVLWRYDLAKRTSAAIIHRHLSFPTPISSDQINTKRNVKDFLLLIQCRFLYNSNSKQVHKSSSYQSDWGISYLYNLN